MNLSALVPASIKTKRGRWQTVQQLFVKMLYFCQDPEIKRPEEVFPLIKEDETFASEYVSADLFGFMIHPLHLKSAI